ncbi:phosphatidylserine/phosphatidylglycerophosphate/cardiolipin synthase family protein [Candidatus Peregrinibacteria bacterium]|nr:phosphatidylserine/phosphatidylglycerophosphate/cardiolipin synthase family protein [Candidatus Peregrinibacteria bacterium]MBI3816461.1 phosphatidylserine/phosphatidylglycerophosphate/cardiolipin synthase family protein [Candidatus Peregrinibacteria bacterium]
MLEESLFQRRTLRSILRGALRYVFGKRGKRRVHGWRLFYRLRYEFVLHSSASMERFRRIHQARVWVDREAFPRIRKLLLRSRHTVVIQMFIWKDDRLGRRMAETLLRIADRGVSVDITKEAVGDLFELHQDFITTRESPDPLWRRFWTHPMIRITYDQHNDHAKVYIIDERILLLTGMNIADEYEHWHDYLVELRGRAFVEHYLTHGDLRAPAGNASLVMNADDRREIRPVVTQLLRNAKRSIVVEHCYVADPAMLDLLIAKSHERVRVRIILPEHPDVHSHTNMQSVARLLSEGKAGFLDVYLFPGMFHGKIVIVDHARAFLGSANLITSSLDEMGEVNVLLEGKRQQALLHLREILRADILRSRPLSGVPSLSWIGRWLAWLQL